MSLFITQLLYHNYRLSVLTVLMSVLSLSEHLVLLLEKKQYILRPYQLKINFEGNKFYTQAMKTALKVAFEKAIKYYLFYKQVLK